jgi:hypothetical protein
VRTKWLVAADAVEGVDYDLDNLTGLDPNQCTGSKPGRRCLPRHLLRWLYARPTSRRGIPGKTVFSPGIAINSLKPRFTDAKDRNHRSRYRWVFIGR